MDWSHAVKLPWEILLLFGGGLSLAGAIDATGLAAWLGGLMTGIGILPVIVLIVVLAGMVVFLTELTSNTATAAVFIPVSAALAGSLDLDPMTLAVPVALAASCAFMMPVATPPNAVVFSAGRLSVVEMCRAGVVMNIIGTAIIAATAIWLLPLVFPAG